MSHDLYERLLMPVCKDVPGKRLFTGSPGEGGEHLVITCRCGPAGSRIEMARVTNRIQLTVNPCMEIARREDFMLKTFIIEEGGQGITEYGAILAFVAILVALVFGITKGALTSAISAAFSAVVVQLNNLSAAAGGAS